jgi:hypothetical protein
MIWRFSALRSQQSASISLSKFWIVLQWSAELMLISAAERFPQSPGRRECQRFSISLLTFPNLGAAFLPKASIERQACCHDHFDAMFEIG